MIRTEIVSGPGLFLRRIPRTQPVAFRRPRRRDVSGPEPGVLSAIRVVSRQEGREYAAKYQGGQHSHGNNRPAPHERPCGPELADYRRVFPHAQQVAFYLGHLHIGDPYSYRMRGSMSAYAISARNAKNT